MRIFMTGATGYVGSAVADALAAAGHDVTALNRSPGKDEGLRGRGHAPFRGDLTDPGGWREEAARHDALVHCAFEYGAPSDADAEAVAALLGAARDGAPEVVVYTSGCWVLGETGEEPADETAPVDRPAEVVAWRPAHERRVLEETGDGVAGAVVRPGMVYGGHSSLTGKLCFGPAAEEGAARCVGDGENRWSMVYRGDLARLYVLLVESRARGVFHGVDGTPLPAARVARAASRAAGAGGDVRHLPLEEAREMLGPVADALSLDQRLAARRSREAGWSPVRTSFVEAAEMAYREWKAARGG